ncbi:MAG: DUF1501 domain-containing protein [Planctomycetota bacterium]|jgi:uncharacterized protein (DUF1501 family)
MPDHDQTYTRRIFLQQSVAFVSLSAAAPLFLQRSAKGMILPASAPLASQPGVPEDRVLVVVQLGGGNDGLNTVVPYGNSAYYNRRPGLAVPAPGSAGRNAAALPIDAELGIGLHPEFSGFKELLDEGVGAIVQGVGYPNPNRSHFASMDVWHTANAEGTGNGWLGRYFDNACGGTPTPDGSVSIGRAAPLALMGDLHKPVSFESAELFRWLGEDLHSALKEPYDAINRRGAFRDTDSESQLGFLLRTALDAQVSSERIRAAVARRPLVAYPGGSLSRQLQVVAAMIRDGMATRVYYVTLSGFDTHANQAGQHANLLRQAGDSLRAFYRDIKRQGNSGRVLTMVFSEFGRRVGQNASGGTDHGTAAPMYLVGDMVKPGLLGRHPSLTNLDQGDLKYNVDFRSVYATVLEDWLGTDSGSVLGDLYRRAQVLA